MADKRMDMEEFLEQVTPAFREMFGIAHAITNQYDAAEYVVQRVIQKAFLQKISGKITFREHMRQMTVRTAVEYVRQNGSVPEGEGTWSGFDTIDVQGNPFLMEAVCEPLQMRRILIMKFGAGLHSYEIAPIIGMDKARVRAYLQQFEARVERKNRKGSSYDKMAKYAAMQDLNRIDADVPDATATYRQLQADMIDPVRPEKESLLKRITGMAVMGFAVLLCIALFWVFAVLMEPDKPVEIPVESGIETAIPEE